MLVNKTTAVVYSVGTSAKDIWEKVIEDEILGTGTTRDSPPKCGWRAERVAICRIYLTFGD
jgi:hypothetical protein